MGNLISNIFLAIPFYFLWNFLVPLYAPQLPSLYRDVPFWHIVGLFVMISILRMAILPKSPALAKFQFKKFRFDEPNSNQPGNYNAFSNIKDVTPTKEK